jgi:hypothetical protein
MVLQSELRLQRGKPTMLRDRVEIVQDQRRPPQPPLRHSLPAAEAEMVVSEPDRHPWRCPPFRGVLAQAMGVPACL